MRKVSGSAFMKWQKENKRMGKELITSSALKFRWINAQCIEIRLNNGRTLLTDPWYTDMEGMGMLAGCAPDHFSIDDIEGADYVFLNHTHGDHIWNLQEVVDRFHPYVLTHSANVSDLMKAYDIPVTDMYALDYEGTYYFDGFVLETHHATHHRRKETMKTDMFHAGDKGTVMTMGGAFNMNFVLTTDQGMRIAFIGGNDDGMTKRLQGVHKPNLIFRNKMGSSKEKENAARLFADWFAETESQILVPMHYEQWLTHDPEFTEQVWNEMNDILEEKGVTGRVAPLERCRWYSLNLSITECE